MIKPEQIPDEVLEAMRESITDTVMFIYEKEARAAIADALNAWPMVTSAHNNDGIFVMRPALILPLPQEGGDA